MRVGLRGLYDECKYQGHVQEGMWSKKLSAGWKTGNPKDQEAAYHVCSTGAQQRCPEVPWWIQGWGDPKSCSQDSGVLVKEAPGESGQAERRIEMRTGMGENTPGGYEWVVRKLT